MSNDNRRHVVPNKDGGGWDANGPGGGCASVHAYAQEQAIAQAKETVGNAGGGEVRIHGRDGAIRDSDTGASGHDRHPPCAER